MERDDEVLLGELGIDNFAEEAIPLVIFNEESKRKYPHFILNLNLKFGIFSFRA